MVVSKSVALELALCLLNTIPRFGLSSGLRYSYLPVHLKGMPNWKERNSYLLSIYCVLSTELNVRNIISVAQRAGNYNVCVIRRSETKEVFLNSHIPLEIMWIQNLAPCPHCHLGLEERSCDVVSLDRDLNHMYCSLKWVEQVRAFPHTFYP